jgi:tetratricopeptide (TPR) repeat protein
MEVYNRALKDNPKDALVYLCRGFTKYVLGQLEDAINDYTLAIEFKLNKPAKVFNLRGRAYHKLEQFEKSREDYTQALILDPRSAHALLVRHELLLTDFDRYEEAIEDFIEDEELGVQQQEQQASRRN